MDNGLLFRMTQPTMSECLDPCTNMKAPVENFLATVLPRPADTGENPGAVTTKSFLCPPKFVVLRKICLNLATGLVLPKLCLQLGYFVLKAIRPRGVA